MTTSGSWRLYCAIARQAFVNVSTGRTLSGATNVDDLGDVREEMKWLCAKARVDYAGDVVRRAVDHVHVSRAVAAGQPRPWSWWICLCGSRNRTTTMRCPVCRRGRPNSTEGVA